ncbi:MAG: hypothetical protein IBX40_09455 [Methanosarcinales archaeon]|nr:hypothetical protein [Methanosarcinales archaeon]
MSNLKAYTQIILNPANATITITINTMIQEIVLAGFVLLLLVPAVYAKDITMSVNQTDYYFITGEEAVVPLKIDCIYYIQ